MSIQGVPLVCSRSRGHFEDVCVLGGDFCCRARASLHADYPANTVVISRQ